MINTAQIEERSEVILGVQDHRYHHPHLCVCVCEARNVQKVLEALTVPNLFEIIIFVQPICLFASKMVKAVQFWPQKLHMAVQNYRYRCEMLQINRSPKSRVSVVVH